MVVPSNDTIDGGSEDDNIDGGSGNDSIDAGSGNDTITGGEGDDVLHGNDGDDTITAGLGADTIEAAKALMRSMVSDGDDTITAGLGADTITGGAGRDQFIFTYEDFLDDYVDVITDFEVGATGDLLDLSNLHEQSLENGFGDNWAGAEFAHHHGYISFAIDGDDTLVSYDQDGLHNVISPKDIIRLEGIQLSSLGSDNVLPAPSDKLYLIEPADTLSEDSGAAVSYRVVLGREPTADVSLQITGGDQIYVNGSSEPVSLTFNADNWFIAQNVSVTAIDDLVIERDHTAPLTHLFNSSDTRFDGLTEDLSVLIRDNDFQRSVEEDQTKLPSDGNNKILYDLDLSANDQYRTDQFNYVPRSHLNNSNYRYDYHGTSDQGPLEGYAAGQGSDLIEISSGLQTALQNKGMIFLGGQGDDSILYANFADGGQGNDTLFASNVESAYDYYHIKLMITIE